MPRLLSFGRRHAPALPPFPSPAAPHADSADLATMHELPHADTPIVLIHGSWLGSWYWLPLAGHLNALGFRVFAPTLTGYGLATPPPHLSFEEMVEPLVSQIEAADIWGGYLLAHSFGGVVAQQVAQRVRKRLDGVIFFDAFIAEPGEAMLDIRGTAGPEFVAGLRALHDEQLNAMSWPFEMFRTLLMPDADEGYARLVHARLRPQPWDVLEERMDTLLFFSAIASDDPTGASGLPLSVSYILAPQDIGPAPGFWAAMARRLGPRCGYIQLAQGDHMVMLTRPHLLASAIRLAVDPGLPSDAFAQRLEALPSFPTSLSAESVVSLN